MEIFLHVGLVGAIILGLVLAYSMVRNRARTPHNERIAEAATREQYRHPETYDPEQFRRGLRPNADGSLPDGAPGSEKR
jgi:hypothetical protein